MAAPGWYPDPAAPAAGYRWWDGSGWTDQVRTAASAAPGSDLLTATQPPVPQPGTLAPPGAPPPPDLPPSAAQFGTPIPPRPQAPPTRRRLPLIIGGAAAIVLLIAAGIFVATRGGDVDQQASDTASVAGSSTAPETTTSETTTTVDPGTTTTVEEQPPTAGGDRISIGVLSYQALGGNWQPLESTVSVLPSTDGQMQVTQDDSPTAGGTFIASVVIGLSLPDVPYSGPDDLESATGLLAQLLITATGAYPAGTTGEVISAEPRDVDGHPAFVMRIELQYNVEGLNATGETVQIAMIDTGQEPAVFWGSVPNDAPQLVPDMEAAFGSLTVDT